MTSSTPKNKVKPTATSAYITPSISPFIRYCRAMSMWRSGVGWAKSRQAHPPYGLFQLALATRVFAVLPDQPLAILGDELGDQRHGILPVVVEGHRADN